MRPWKAGGHVVWVLGIWLQWGHGLAAVEGFNSFSVGGCGRRASMGPRPCGRGRRRRSARACRADPASMGPRPCGRGRLRALRAKLRLLMLQWGHGLAAVEGASTRATSSTSGAGFNGATALRPWKVGGASVVKATVGSLQWGHGLAAVEGGHAGPWQAPQLPASMGPRPCGRGREHGVPCLVGDFDASMGPRPCGRGRSSRSQATRGSQTASMGPRPCGRGRRRTPSNRTRPRSRFNGATALRPWKADMASSMCCR